MCLVILFILCLLYTIVRLFKNVEQFDTPQSPHTEFYQKFAKLNFHLDSLEPVDFTFPYPVYYINLDSDTNKNQFILDQVKYFGSQNDNIHRISAIDARKKVPTRLDGHFIQSNLKLSNPEMGCLLSHIKAIITAYTSGDEYAIILEDDAYFKHARLWKSSIQDIINAAPLNWNILNLYNSTICCKDLFKDGNYVKHSSNTNCYLTSSYIINRQGMYNILKRIRYIDANSEPMIYLFTKNVNKYHGADELLFQWAGNTYFVKPTTFFVYNDDEKMKTSIQPDSDLQNQIINALYVIRQFI